MTEVVYKPLGDDAPGAGPSEDEIRLTMVDSSGALYRVPMSSADQAEKKGWKYASAEQVRSAPQDVGVVGQAASASLGALSGLTAGISDPIVAKAAAAGGGMSYEEAAQGVEGLARDAPVAHGVGTVAGILGGAYLTGGQTMALEGGLAARMGGSAVARTGAGALVGVTEGGLQGGLYGLSRGLLGDGELTAERVLADAGMGALFGGVAGGVTGRLFQAPAKAKSLVEEAVEAGGKAEGRSLVADAVEAGAEKEGGLFTKFAQEGALKATGARGSDLRAIGSASRRDGVADTLRNYTFRTGEKKGQKLLKWSTTADGLVEPVEQAVRESSEALKGLKAQVVAASEASGSVPDVKRILQRIDEEVIAPLRSDIALPAQRKEADFLERQLEPLRKRLVDVADSDPDGMVDVKPLSWAELDTYRARLGAYVWPDKAPAGGVTVMKRGAEELRSVERIVADEVKTSGERILRDAGKKDAANAFRKAHTEVSHLITVQELVRKAQGQKMGNQALSLTDNVVGTGMAVGGALGAIASGNLLYLAAGPGSAVANKFLREHAPAALAALAGKLEKQGNRLDIALSALASTKPVARATRAGRTVAGQEAARKEDRGYSDQRFEEMYKTIVSWRSKGPKLRMETSAGAGEAVASEYPRLAGAIAAKHVALSQLALKRIPSGLTGKGLQQHLEPPRIPAPDRRRFVSYMSGLTDPIGVIEDVAGGDIDRDAIDAVREGYPKLWEETRQELSDRIASLEEPLARQSLMPIALAFDLEADGRSHGPTIASVQSALMTPPDKGGDEEKREINPKIAEQAQTREERIS